MIKYVLVMGNNWFQMANRQDDLPIIDGCHIEKWIYVKSPNGHHLVCKRKMKGGE